MGETVRAAVCRQFGQPLSIEEVTLVVCTATFALDDINDAMDDVRSVRCAT